MRQRSEWPRFPDGRVRERRPNGRGPYWWTCSDPRWSFNHSTEQKCSVFPYEGCAMPDSDCGWEYLPDLR